MRPELEYKNMIDEGVKVESDETLVGLFAIKLDQIKLKEFMQMRKLIPRRDYTLIKNRFSARDNRSRKRNMLEKIRQQNRRIQIENERFRRMLEQR